MKHFFFILGIVIFAMLGCSAENPVTPDEEVEETALPDTTDVETPAFRIESVDMTDIVANTTTGHTTYEGHLITITATVLDIELIPDGNSSLALDTNKNNVNFYVESDHNPEAFADYKIGETYDFTVYIDSQERNKENEPVISNVWSNLAKKDVEDITLDTLLSDAKLNNKRYQGSVIRFTATIRRVDPNGNITIETDRNDAAFLITKTILDRENQYLAGQSYTFNVYLWIIGDGKPDHKPYITCFFIKSEWR